MSFGVSIGDVLAVRKLVTDIIPSPKDSGGSRTDYQDLVRELECLRAGLVYLDKLSGTGTSQELAAIKYAALSCRRPLEEFLARIRKYDGSLGTQFRSNAIEGVIDKITFSLARREEAPKLQAYLTVRVGMVNALPAEHGLEKMQLAAENTELSHLHIEERLDNTNNLLGRVQTSVTSQTHAILKSVEKMRKFPSGHLCSPSRTR
ncbi:hypothetical protein F4776DRAFT_575746 [Hypoxylon sp. NC0597]|nr:hypothetical protein F4776DRAFT_575746 [Hypoxylon sp. NC0597]